MTNHNSIKTKINLIFNGASANFRIILFILSISSIFTYLLVVNHLNTLGIEMGQLKVKIAALQDQNRDLENTATQLKSMQRIEQIGSQQLLMVSADNYQYLPEASTVAVKK
ncbi:MAG: hypothetical protein NTZ18_04425 [Candidatus Komeilibacteria bacterium]|nr:hypothetical protein [Candidatus Komeilibacteria bacterium]